MARQPKVYRKIFAVLFGVLAGGLLALGLCWLINVLGQQAIVPIHEAGVGVAVFLLGSLVGALIGLRFPSLGYVFELIARLVAGV